MAKERVLVPGEDSIFWANVLTLTFTLKLCSILHPPVKRMVEGIWKTCTRQEEGQPPAVETSTSVLTQSPSECVGGRLLGEVICDVGRLGQVLQYQARGRIALFCIFHVFLANKM